MNNETASQQSSPVAEPREQLVAAVEQTTGYKVVIDTVEGIGEDAQMITARPELPVHTIRVSKARLRHADYIVANQCAMILRLWSEPARIPVFSPIAGKVSYFSDRTANSKPLARQPVKVAQETATYFVQGLLHQVRSMPLEILTVRDCRELCPDLHDMQAEAAESQLRLLSDVLAPKIRSIAPDQIWRNNVSMNAAFALNWSGLSGSPLAMLPYESAGFGQIAAKLLGIVKANSAKTTDAYTQMVDTWAEQVGLRTLYTWGYRNGK
jgi:hypothetical protein